MEIIDYFDENENKIGIKSREEVHAQNLWHREVALWIINQEGLNLFQKRSHQKINDPDLWAITAGHLNVGEEPKEAIIREAKEEIGLEINSEKLEFIAKYQEANREENNCIFQYIYVIRTDKKEKEFVLQPEEVSEVFYHSIEWLEEKMKQKHYTTFSTKNKYDQIMIDRMKEYVRDIRK